MITEKLNRYKVEIKIFRYKNTTLYRNDTAIFSPKDLKMNPTFS